MLAACQAIPPPTGSAVLAEPPAAEVSVASAAPRFTVDPRASEVRLLVYRDGPLARFGHNHVVIGRVEGEVRAADTAAGSAFRLEIPVASFAVDPPAARAEEGADFAAEVSEQARKGTRENMLGADVLDAARYPFLRIASVALAGPRWNPTVTARVTLRGVTRDVRFPAAVFKNGDAVEVIAFFRVRQSDFGLKPFAVFGGGLLVRDAIEIRVRVVARQEPPRVVP